MVLFAKRLSAVVPLGHKISAAVFGPVRLESCLGGPQIPVSPGDQWCLCDVRQPSCRKVAMIPRRNPIPSETDVSVRSSLAGQHAPTLLRQTATAEQVLGAVRRRPLAEARPGDVAHANQVIWVNPGDQKRPAEAPTQAIANGTVDTLSRLNGERPPQGRL